MTVNKIKPAFGIGAITILMVLLVLCISTFATLTFFSARADLQFSKMNATTISAYYEADAYASQLFAEFIAGTDDSLETIIPMTNSQSLSIHLNRKADGTVEVLTWQTIVSADDSIFSEPTLPVWGSDIL